MQYIKHSRTRSVFIKKLILISVCLLVFISCGKDSGEVKIISNGNSDLPEKWDMSRFPILIDFHRSFEATYDNDINDAIAEWNAALGVTALTYRYYDTSEIQYADLNEIVDGKSYVSMQTDWGILGLSVDSLAVTISYITNGIISDADVVFNTSYSFYPTSSPVSIIHNYHFKTVLLHELGHYLGLPHVSVEDNPNSIMNPTIQNTDMKDIHSLDTNNVKNLYGL